uniref:CARD domain-containing protein n=1 Tax=Gadus morhua TaxID=8049 RepID=A0A8C5AHQ0_GADMO
LPEEILRIRSKFVQRVTIQVLKGLLDDLYEREVVSLEEKDSLMEEWRSKADRARCLADMVIGKGEEASQKMIDSMKERDKHLCSTLGLFSSPSAAVAEL